MKRNFFEAVQNRRSLYAIGKTVQVSEARIREILETAVKHVPSPFNSQSGRLVLLLGKESSEYWNIVRNELKKIVAVGEFEKTEAKLKGFDGGYGTILFFEDQAIVEGLMKRFPTYADNFPIWSLQSNGMLEYVIWTALQDEGLGSSLQHYNPLVDKAVRKQWNLPETWKLLAQMPFGSIEAAAGTKEFSSIEERLKVIGTL